MVEVVSRRAGGARATAPGRGDRADRARRARRAGRRDARARAERARRLRPAGRRCDPRPAGRRRRAGPLRPADDARRARIRSRSSARPSDGREVLAAVDRHRPDVVLMDIRMPQLDGIEATRLLRAQPSPPAVIVLTTFDADELVLRALRAGAAGFLLKDTPPAEIVRAIEHVHAGEGMLSPTVTRRLIALVADDGGRREDARAAAGDPEPARARGRAGRRPRLRERGDRGRAAHERRDREGARLAAAGQARRREPRPDRAAGPGRARAQAGERSRRLTSPPSARPLVSRMTGPTSAPIAFALPPLMRSTMSGLSAITLATIASSSPESSIAVRPSRSAISAGSPPSATSLSRIVRPAAAVTVRAATSCDELGQRRRLDRRAVARAQLGDPVRDRLRVRRRRPPARSSRPTRARTRTGARCPRAGRSRARSAPRARPGSSGIAARADSIIASSARSARGRAPGSSGSRAPPPWSAAS